MKKSRILKRIVPSILISSLIAAMGAGAFAADSAAAKQSTYGKYAGYGKEDYPKYVVKSLYVEVPAFYVDAARSDPDYTGQTVKLALDYVLPADSNGKVVEGKFPTVVTVSRGGRFTETDTNGGGKLALNLVRNGYAYVIVEMRGCGASFGVCNSFASVENRKDVAYIMEKWIANQSWSNGKYAMMGGSNRGLIQNSTMVEAPKGLLGITPVVNNPDFYYQDYINGVSTCPSGMNLSGTALDTTPKSYEEWKAKTTTKFVDDDPKGEQAYQAYVIQTMKNKPFTSYLLMPNLLRDQEHKDLYNEKVNLTIPPVEYSSKIKASGIKIHQLAGYFDSNATAQVIEANAWGGTVVLGPWNHSGAIRGTMSDKLYPNSTFDVEADYLRWFDYLLKGIDNGYDKAPPFYYYVAGADSGKEWRYADNLPLDNQQNTVMYFSNQGTIGDALKLSGAQSNNGALSASKPADSSIKYTVDTSIKVPADYNGMNLTSTEDWSQAVDSKGLTFTSAPFKSTTQIVGIPKLDLWISCENYNDVDFIAYLEKVTPDGKSTYLSRAYIRASHRITGKSDFYDSTPGTVYHTSTTKDVQTALSEGLAKPVHLEATFDIVAQQLAADTSLRVTVTCANTATSQHYMYYDLVEGKYVLKTSNLPKITLYQGGDKASSITVPMVQSVSNVINGKVTFSDGSYTGPGTMYLFKKNYYLYANGKWSKFAVGSKEAEYKVVKNAGVFKNAGFTFMPEGDKVADGVAQNYAGGAANTYSFPTDNQTKSGVNTLALVIILILIIAVCGAGYVVVNKKLSKK